MINTVKHYSAIASKICHKATHNQLIKTNNNLFGDFKLHNINNVELEWAIRHSENHLCFLEVLHSRQIEAHLEYDPLRIVPIEESKRLLQILSLQMNKLNADRIARSLLVKKKFAGCHNGVQLITYNGFVFPSSDRRHNGT